MSTQAASGNQKAEPAGEKTKLKNVQWTACKSRTNPGKEH